jgi:hypothetical protein
VATRRPPSPPVARDDRIAANTRLIRTALLTLQENRCLPANEIRQSDPTAKLRKNDIPNFLAPRPNGSYRTNLDEDRLRSIQNYLKQHVGTLSAKLDQIDDRDAIYAASQLPWADAEDAIGLFFTLTGVLNPEKKKEILERCGGTYYLLRWNADNDDVVCSILHVVPRDIPNRAPQFTNILSEDHIRLGEDDAASTHERRVQGHVVELGVQYGFLGFIQGRAAHDELEQLQSWAGLKIILFRSERTGISDKNGIVLSMIGADTYHFGTIRAIPVTKFERDGKRPLIRPGFYSWSDIASLMKKKNGTTIHRDSFANAGWPGHEYRAAKLSLPSGP